MRENLLIIGKKVGDKRRRNKMSSRFNGARSWSISSLFGLSDISQFELFCFVENNIGHNVCHGKHSGLQKGCYSRHTHTQ